ncbi:MAG: citrate synthase [Firmicutes bacterium]|nr:citrate synthase [Bacillota bacterium]
MPENTEYRPGLEGVIAAETSISYLDVEHEEIVIRGYDLIQLARTVSYLDVAHLLLHGWLPSVEESAAWAREIAQVDLGADRIVPLVDEMGPQMHMMDWLRTAVSVMGTWDPDVGREDPDATLAQGRRLLATLPTVLAQGYRRRQHLPVIVSDPGLGYAANFLHMITGTEPTPAQARAFDQLLTVYIEHEMPNSTFAAIVISSTLADLYGALTGAVASLKGRLHGGANEAVMHMLFEVGNPAKMRPYLEEKLARKERIMGFGHRVYMRRPDPRAVLMKELLTDLVKSAGRQDLYDLCVAGEEAMYDLKGLYPNLDYYAAPVYYLLGVPIELYTPIFFAARTAGLVAHVREQYAQNRLFRPRVRYIGPRGLTVTR